MNDSVKLNSQTIRALGQDIIRESEELMKMLDIAKGKVDDSIAIYDSPTATQFRSKMGEFTRNAKNGATTSLTNLANYFEKVAVLYEETDEEILEVANQYLSTDIFVDKE